MKNHHLNAVVFGATVAAIAFTLLSSRLTGATPAPKAIVSYPGGSAQTNPNAPFFATVAAAIKGDGTDAAATPIPAVVGNSHRDEPLPGWLPAGVLSWEAEIHEASNAVDLDPLALAAVMAVECPSGDTNCRSSVGAMSLGQIMPDTATFIQNASGIPCAGDPWDGATSLRCAAWYYMLCLKTAGALWSKDNERAAIGVAASGYNGGPGFIPEMVARVRAGADPCDTGRYEEMRKHCAGVLAVWDRSGRK